MDYRKLIRVLVFPHTVIVLTLIPISTVILVGSLVFLETDSLVAILSYVLAAYTLAVSCVKIPNLIKFIEAFKSENKYAKLWLSDAHLRVKISLYGSLLWNVAYAVFQMWHGFYHGTFWYCSLAFYYVFLAVMRFFLARYTAMHKPGDDIRLELIKYRSCGVVFLLMNLALSLIVFFMVYWNRTFLHHQITTIAMAAYTFTSFTIAIVNIIKYRRYNSPVYSASKAISLAAACVSMLTLTSTMLTTFGGSSMDAIMQKIMLASVGGTVSLFIIVMAIYMIVESNKKLKELKEMTNG